MAKVAAKFIIGGKDQAHHWWWFALLGIVLIAGGAFMLGHLAAATIVSAIFIGAAALVLGAFQIVKAFNTRRWSGALLNAGLGALYVFAGAVLWANPVAAAVSLTLLLAISGGVAILAGLVIFFGWPATGLWVLGLVLAIDVLFQGFAWLMFGFALRPKA